MQIIINIDNNIYNHTQEYEDGEFSLENNKKLFQAIKNGTPLSKGHGRLIDADRLLRENCIDVWTDYGWESKISGLSIENAPTIIEADKA